MPDEVALNVSNDNGEILMEMDGFTGSSQGCVPPGCYTVEMMDSSGDGWNGAFAELFIDGALAGTMALEEGNSETRVIGIGIECETPDNGGDKTMSAATSARLLKGELPTVQSQPWPRPNQSERPRCQPICTTEHQRVQR